MVHIGHIGVIGVRVVELLCLSGSVGSVVCGVWCVSATHQVPS